MQTSFFENLDVLVNQYTSLGIPIACIVVGYGNAHAIKEIYKVLFVEDTTDLAQRMDIMNQVSLNQLSYRGIAIVVSDKFNQLQFVFRNTTDAIRVANMKDVIQGPLPDNVIPFKKR